MTAITAALVKDLRDRTGAGMMDCKTALTEAKGDIEAAIDLLRKKGLAKAVKKAGRVAADGLIGVASKGTTAAVVEVNSETDFVAKNSQFQEFVSAVAKLAIDAKGDTAKLLTTKFPGTSHDVETHTKELVATIGENMSVRRAAAISVKEGAVGVYVHNVAAPGLGKIGVLVGLESAGKNVDELSQFGRMVAMHIAAANPLALDLASVPGDVLAREKAIIADKNQGKKPEVLEKIFQSSLKTFAKDNCLLDQIYVHDGAKTVAQAVKEAEGKVGGPIKLTGFVFFKLGDGVEKKSDDFAEEVAKLTKG